MLFSQLHKLNKTALSSNNRSALGFSSFGKQFRGFAEEAKQLRLTFAVPHDVFYNNQPVNSVRVPGLSGEFGIFKDHVPTIAELKPGVVAVSKADKDGKAVEEEYFVSGGFAFVHRDSTCSVNAIEAFPLNQFDPEVAKENLRQAQADLAKATSEEDRVKAYIGLEVHGALCSALKVTA